MACSTSFAVPGLTVRVRFTTCETVDTETPARRATSTIVAIAVLGVAAARQCHRADPPASAPAAVAGLPRPSGARLVGSLDKSIETFAQAFFSGDSPYLRLACRGRFGALGRAAEFLFPGPPICAGIVSPVGLFNGLTEGRR